MHCPEGSFTRETPLPDQFNATRARIYGLMDVVLALKISKQGPVGAKCNSSARANRTPIATGILSDERDTLRCTGIAGREEILGVEVFVYPSGT